MEPCCCGVLLVSALCCVDVLFSAVTLANMKKNVDLRKYCKYGFITDISNIHGDVDMFSD